MKPYHLRMNRNRRLPLAGAVRVMLRPSLLLRMRVSKVAGNQVACNNNNKTQFACKSHIGGHSTRSFCRAHTHRMCTATTQPHYPRLTGTEQHSGERNRMAGVQRQHLHPMVVIAWDVRKNGTEHTLMHTLMHTETLTRRTLPDRLHRRAHDVDNFVVERLLNTPQRTRNPHPQRLSVGVDVLTASASVVVVAAVVAVSSILPHNLVFGNERRYIAEMRARARVCECV